MILRRYLLACVDVGLSHVPFPLGLKNGTEVEMSRDNAVWVQRYLVRTAARATVFGTRVRRFLSEPEREPADPDSMFSLPWKTPPKFAILPEVSEGLPLTADDQFFGSRTVLIPLCTRMVRTGASMDVSMPVSSLCLDPSEHGLVGRCRTCAK